MPLTLKTHHLFALGFFLLSPPLFAQRGPSPCERLYHELRKELASANQKEEPSLESAYLACRKIEDEMMQSGISSDKETLARQKAEDMFRSAESKLGHSSELRSRGR